MEAFLKTLQGPDWRFVNPASAQHGGRWGQNKHLAGWGGKGEEGGHFKACCCRPVGFAALSGGVCPGSWPSSVLS